MLSDQSKWAANYKKTLENPPEIGAILTTFSDEDAKMTAELKQSTPPFIFARAYVPELLGEPLGWHLRDAKDNSFHGWRCVLLPRARAEVIQKIGLGELNADETEGTLFIRSLKVIRYSASRNAILCEVHEYCTKETIAKTPEEEGDELAALNNAAAQKLEVAVAANDIAIVDGDIESSDDVPQQAAEEDILELSAQDQRTEALVNDN